MARAKKLKQSKRVVRLRFYSLDLTKEVKLDFLKVVKSRNSFTSR